MLPPITKRAYALHNKKLYDFSLKKREASFAAAELRIDASEDDIIDIAVTCDSTWSRRGFQTLYNVVVVDSWGTGKFGCGNSQQILPGLCSSSRHGRVV